MIFELVRDFADALAAMPEGHRRRHLLTLLDEAVRRDVHVVARHPTALFQCLWNSGWWYDSPEAAGHYDLSKRTRRGRLPWECPARRRLSTVLEGWRGRKETATPGFPWVRSLRPPRLRLGAGQRMVLRGHSDRVASVVFSPDGNWVASGGRDQDVRLWDARTGRPLAILTGCTTWVLALAFSPDGRRVAAAGSDGVRVWDAITGQEHLSLAVDLGSVDGMSFSADGTRLCLAGRKDIDIGGDSAVCWEARVWDAGTGRKLLSWKGGRHQQFAAAAFAPDGRRVVTTDNLDGKLTVCDTGTGREVLSFELPGGPAALLAYSPDGRSLAAATPDGIAVVDAQTGREQGRLGPQNGHGLQLTFSPDGRRLGQTALGRGGGVVRVWDLQTGREALTLARGSGVGWGAVAFSPDGRGVALAGNDNAVQVWDALEEPEVLELAGYEGPAEVGGLAFSPDGTRLGTVAEDQDRVIVWDAQAGRIRSSFAAAEHDDPDFSIDHLEFSPDGTRVRLGSPGLGTATGAEDNDRTPPGARPGGGGAADPVLSEWDPATGRFLGTVAGGPKPDGQPAGSPWQLTINPVETSVAEAASGRPAAWLPVVPDHAVLHPTSRLLAIAAGEYIGIMAFEGGEGGSRQVHSRPGSSPP